MNITSIQNYKTNSAFRAKDYVVKKDLLNRNTLKKEITNIEKQNSDKIAKLVLSGLFSTFGIDLLLKEKDVTYCDISDKTISFACGQDGGFYQIKTDNNFTKAQAKEYLFRTINDESISLGGFENYYKLLKNIGRQDIVKKGLKIHTYEMNTNVTTAQKNQASANLIDYIKIPIKPSDLFYLEDEAFYYDKVTKTVYGVNLNETQLEGAIPAFRICKFITDSKGKAIGYRINDWNFYYGKNIETEYVEQQEPSIKLPPVVSQKNLKEIAEAFRFGNAEPDLKMNNSISNVLNYLQKVKINAVSKDLQFIKFANKNKKVLSRIGYYNHATGTSMIFNQEGKYMCQMEYIKDDSGNITSCSSF